MRICCLPNPVSYLPSTPQLSCVVKDLEKRVCALAMRILQTITNLFCFKISSATIPARNRPSFEAIHTFSLKPTRHTEDVTVLEKQFSVLPQDLNVTFDKTTSSVTFGYDEFSIRALAIKYQIIEKVIGSGHRTCFDGYVNRYGWTLNKADDYSEYFHLEHPSTKTLIQGSEAYFQDKEYLANTLALNRTLSLQAQVRELLSHSTGLFIGECHSDDSPKAFLYAELPSLVQQGVDTFYFEHLCFEGLQKDLDAYFSDKSSKMSTALTCALQRLDSGNFLTAMTYLDLVERAKACGIRRIVCIDSAASYRAGTSQRDGVTNSNNRHAAFIYNAKHVMERERAQNKYIALVGASHLNSHQKVPGFGQLFKVPELFILDSTKNQITLTQNCKCTLKSGKKVLFPFVAQIPKNYYTISGLLSSHNEEWKDDEVVPF